VGEGKKDRRLVVSTANLLPMIMVLHHNLHELRVLLALYLILLSRSRSRTKCLAVDDESVVIVGFNCDVVYNRSWDVPVEIVVVCVLFQIETRDEAVHETMTTGEMTVEFIDVMKDWREISVNSIAVTTATSCE
jgi:hypothetical protein